MSLKALLWVLYDIPPKKIPNSDFRIMAILADHADPEGRGAWPHYKTIARLAGCSVSNVKHRILELEDKGLIRRGDQHLVDHLPKGKHPVVWDLCMDVDQHDRGANIAPLEEKGPEVQTEVQKTAGRGANRGATCLHLEPNKEEPYIEPRESNARARKTTQIPTDWKPSDEHRALADQLGIDCDTEARKFQDRALDTGTQSADWDAKFRIWLMRGHELGYATAKNQKTVRKYTWASDEVKRIVGTDLEGTDDWMALACRVAELLNEGVDPAELSERMASFEQMFDGGEAA